VKFRLIPLGCLLFAGCVAHVRTIAELRQHPVGSPEIVAGNFRELASAWDENAGKASTDGSNATSLRIDDAEARAEIRVESSVPYAMIVLEHVTDHQTRITAYGWDGNINRHYILPWLDLLKTRNSTRGTAP
jgi:hypothetical protein